VRFACKTAIVAFMVSGWNMLVAQENAPHGFLNIPFGATREALVAEMKSRYKMRPSFPLTQWPLNGSGMDLLWTSDQVYCLKNFALGNRLFTVLLYFNNDGRFYGFRLKGESDRRDRIPLVTTAGPAVRGESGLTSQESADLLEDAMFVAKVFEKKYGMPSGLQEYNAADIYRNAERLFCIQRTGRYFKAVGTLCAGVRKHGDKSYAVVAIVYDKKLGNNPAGAEGLVSPDSQHAKEERKQIEKAAGSF